MRFFLLMIFVGCLSAGCFRQSKPVDVTEKLSVPAIDLSQESYPVLDDDIESVVKYIPLETSKDVIIDSRHRLVHYSNNRIVLLNDRKGDIFVFDGEGKILSHFNRTGKGPEEYLYLTMHIRGSVVVYDEANREIFVMEKIGICRVYSEDGTYLRTFRFPKRKQYREAYDFDNESLLVYDANIKTDSAFVFLSKKDGKVLSHIDIPLHKRIANEKIQKSPAMILGTIGTPRQQLLKDGDDFILAEMSSDTIYRFTKDKHLIPVLARIPSIKNSETHIAFQPLKVTEKCVLGFKYVFDLNSKEKLKLTTLLYDIEKRRAFEFKGSPNIEYYVSGFVIRDCTDLPSGLYVMTGFPDRILDDFEKGRLKGKIKEVAAQVNEGDNPVLQVIKIK